MIAARWIVGRLRHQGGRLAATAAGVAVTVALLASLGEFLAHSRATMTQRSIANVVVDWQVEGAPGTTPAQLDAAVTRHPGVRAARLVAFARVTGLRATTNGSDQVTGPGYVLGVPADYAAVFPGVIRPLTGSANGVIVAQQTAANLHVAPGDIVEIGRAGLRPARVTIDGVVDLPTSDTLFQTVGAPAGASPNAPPDNVVVVPLGQWHALFDPLAAVSADLVRTQVHARVTHDLPSDPAAAFATVVRRANNLEVDLAGTGRVADNLGAALDAARSDALYAQVLFAFLGIPGAVLAALLTVAIAASGRDRRRQEVALLRTRGATTAAVMRLAVAETAAVTLLGATVGVAAAWVVGRSAFGHASLLTDTTASVVWLVAAVAVGLITATFAVAIPASSDARNSRVAAARRDLNRTAQPWWTRMWLDVVLLGLGALVFWLTSRTGYQLVLAPEGVPSISVSYWAFIGPALLWIGGGLFVWRLGDLAAGRGRRVLAFASRPLAGALSDTVAATMQRQRRLLARGVALVSVTAAFAASTAVFNATYRQQSHVDALLTNGADVTVTEPPTSGAAVSIAGRLGALPGVVHVEAIRHRYAYVGADLQDLYGVDPRSVVAATKLQDAYFRGGSAVTVMHRLAQRRDGVIVSAETAHDYQLSPGDRLNLRLVDAATHRYVTVPFHYLAIGLEFPTAPRDSFLIANSAYVAQRTHDSTFSEFLVDTGGRNQVRVAGLARRTLGPGTGITDLTSARRVVASSLTAVDLRGLSTVELGFALVLTAAATGLVLWLGYAERRRAFAITAALGATARQLAAFVCGESVFVLLAGLALGAVGGALMSRCVVAILTGVFDPPPSALAVPWAYLAAAGAVAVTAVIAASSVAVLSARRPSIAVLRGS